MSIGEFILFMKESQKNSEEVMKIRKGLDKDNIKYRIEKVDEGTKFVTLPQLTTPLGPFLSYESYLNEKEKENKRK